MGVTEQLCERICATGYDDLTEDAKTAARRLVLDGLAVAVACREALGFGAAFRPGNTVAKPTVPMPMPRRFKN